MRGCSSSWPPSRPPEGPIGAVGAELMGRLVRQCLDTDVEAMLL